MHVDFGKYEHVPMQISLDNQTLAEVSIMKILGILIQSDLKWDGQVSSMISKANRRMYILRSLIPFKLRPRARAAHALGPLMLPDHCGRQL